MSSELSTARDELAEAKRVLLLDEQKRLSRLLTLAARDDGFHCYHCGSPAVTREGSFVALGEERTVWTCPDCGLSQLRERYVEEDVEQLEEGNAWYPTDVENTEQLVTDHGFIVPFMQEFQPQPGRLLEIGCSHGYKLEAARRQGWEVEGIELLPRAWKFAHEHLKLPVHRGTLESYMPTERFDAIVFWHVLEHVPSLHSFLEHVHAYLKPGGHALLQVPSFDLVRELDWQEHPAVFNAVHYWYFTEAALTRTLQSFGFEIVRSFDDLGLGVQTVVCTRA